MKLEPANIICPKCGNGNYMWHLIGKNVGKLDMKCINCNSYFNFDELYKQKIAEIVKPPTNADRIRAMTDEELASLLMYFADDTGEIDEKDYDAFGDMEWRKRILRWLKQEVTE